MTFFPGPCVKSCHERRALADDGVRHARLTLVINERVSAVLYEEDARALEAANRPR